MYRNNYNKNKISEILGYNLIFDNETHEYNKHFGNSLFKLSKFFGNPLYGECNFYIKLYKAKTQNNKEYINYIKLELIHSYIDYQMILWGITIYRPSLDTILLLCKTFKESINCNDLISLLEYIRHFVNIHDIGGYDTLYNMGDGNYEYYEKFMFPINKYPKEGESYYFIKGSKNRNCYSFEDAYKWHNYGGIKLINNDNIDIREANGCLFTVKPYMLYY